MRIFDGTYPLLWPDIDLYFKGDLDVAAGLIDQIHSAEGEWVKGALLHDVNLCLDRADARVSYHVEGRGRVTEPYREVLARHVVSLPDSRRLFADAIAGGLKVALSVYDLPGLALAIDIGVHALKMPSSNIVHAPLIRAAAGEGVPLAIDTGRSTMDEIARAVDWASAAGAEEICVQHSPPGPPAPPDAHHLDFINTLRTAFGTAVGLSDHHRGPHAMFAACAMGVDVIEKAVCPDDAREDVDLSHAMRISDVAATWQGCRTISAMRGDGNVRAAMQDLPTEPARMGVVTAMPVRPGDAVADAVTYAFPAVGIAVEDIDRLRHARFTRDLPAGVPVTWSDVCDVDA